MIFLLLSLPVAFILGVAATLIVLEWQARKARRLVFEFFNKHTN